VESIFGIAVVCHIQWADCNPFLTLLCRCAPMYRGSNTATSISDGGTHIHTHIQRERESLFMILIHLLGVDGCTRTQEQTQQSTAPKDATATLTTADSVPPRHFAIPQHSVWHAGRLQCWRCAFAVLECRGQEPATWHFYSCVVRARAAKLVRSACQSQSVCVVSTITGDQCMYVTQEACQPINQPINQPTNRCCSLLNELV
jgi:hypothetical protein